MQRISLTDQQRRAVRFTGRSILVSAAAGSGKTSVLAERCAYLVCDAPSKFRCSVDELLVLTFTEAAAAEMRSRIVDAIRARAEKRPGDHRLREQMDLAEAAQISTVHSFCLWLIRRWFNEAGIDPTATVLGAEEEALLKSEVLDGLFSELYAASREQTAAPSGTVAKPSRDREGAGFLPPSPQYCNGPLGAAFVKLVDDYGLGEDRYLSKFVLRLFDFLTSLTDPDAWLREAYESLTEHPHRVILASAEELKAELNRQAEHCEHVAADIEAGDPAGHFYASRIRAYVDRLRAWAQLLDRPTRGTTADVSYNAHNGDVAEELARFESVRRQINAFEFDKARGPRLPKDAGPDVRAARDTASAQLSLVKNRLFGERLKNRFGLFSVDKLIADLKKTAPYVSTIVELVTAFRDAYTRRKRELNVLDFADLERLAFDLLSDKADPHQPSDVARALHRRFAHALVDEFQDINPIQQAIIRLVSRESDPDRADNLFAVGDVKQSIYRFRLGEPAIFTDRLNRFRTSDDGGAAVFLQDNFRSRPQILEAINVVFRQLMRKGCGDIVYDTEAELHPGREVDPNEGHEPVELHLLERKWDDASPEDDEAMEHGVVADPSDPARWAPIEREAFLIGSHIRAWKDSGWSTRRGEPLRYGDVVVLLRAAKINAERMAGMLSSMGIPAYAEVGGSLFDTREIHDVVAVLEVLDNLQQDIPLAAVLRSGIMGEKFSEDELVEIRCLDREVPFHAAVRRYAERGDDATVRRRLRSLLDCIDRYRRDVRRQPLADVIWRLYQRQGYLAYAGGLPNGAQRRANLLKLHELARQFGSFRRQGLHRFLRFIRSLQDEQQRIASAPTGGEADDVVRIMSIHQAKGLEFPVVFVAGLGGRFNLGDRIGRMIFERASRIGLRVVDAERMIEYPTAAHRQVTTEIERTTREEELRILYVAMTRARDKLVLVGSERNVDRHREGRRIGDGPTTLEIATATTPLDWLMPVLRGSPVGVVSGLGTAKKTEPRPSGSGQNATNTPMFSGDLSRKGVNNPLFEVHVHGVEEMAGWCIGESLEEDERAVRRAAARCDALPPGEPLAPGDSVVEETLSRIEYVYPYLAATSVRASMAVSEFEGAYDFLRNPEEQDRRHGDDEFRVPPSKYALTAPDDAAHRGVVTHKVLQHMDFLKAVDAAGVASELQRIVNEGLISAEDSQVVDQDSIAWFVSTPLAGAIREAGEDYRREFLFISAEPLACFDRSVDAPPEDRVLVRGMVDGILPVSEGIEILDFKTDAIRPEEVDERSERYRPQMTMYARAMSRIWRRPVRTCRLVFLAARKLVAWNDAVQSACTSDWAGDI